MGLKYPKSPLTRGDNDVDNDHQSNTKNTSTNFHKKMLNGSQETEEHLSQNEREYIKIALNKGANELQKYEHKDCLNYFLIIFIS